MAGSPDQNPGADPVPLVVDLDGSLVVTDTLHENLARLMTSRPLLLWRVPLWLGLGKAGFKEALARHVPLDPATLPYRRTAVDFITAQRQLGRHVILATGANAAIADGVAGHLALFDQVLASSADVNLTGERKLAEIQRTVPDDRPFDYLGNARADVPVWRRARRALAVGLGAGERARLASEGIDVEVIDGRRPGSLRALVRCLRLHQWAKNLLIFIPAVTSHVIVEGPVALHALLAFLAFGCMASSVYVVNDLLDLPADRVHPTKQHRPFASGDLPLAAAVGLVPLLVALAVALAWALPAEFQLFLALYLVLTTAYSFRLKRTIAIDAVVLASLYTLRLGAGGAAVGVTISPWLFAFAMFLFLSLALVKRTSELVGMGRRNVERSAGRGYRAEDIHAIVALGAAAAYSAVLVFALYVNLSPDVQHLYRHPNRLLAVCPVLIYWLSRIWILARRGEVVDDPVVFALRDRVSFLAVLATLAIGWTAL